MATFRYIAFSAMLLTIAFVHPAFAREECAALSTQMQHIQRELYRYALISEVAYGQRPSNMCLVEESNQQIVMPEYELFPLLPKHVETIWRPQILERWRANSHRRPDRIDRYTGDDEVTYITCTYAGTTTRLVLTWKEFIRMIERDGAPSDIGAYLQVLPVIRSVDLPPSEELGIVKLTLDSDPGRESEELVAIRGTDFTRIPQIMASVNNLLGGSCVYEMAAVVISVIGENVATGRFSVVGHSLGGGAAQYVVEDHTRHRWRNPANRQHAHVTFRAYSYNAMGIDGSSKANLARSGLYSYIIDGEIISSLAEEFGRTQAGTIIRYLPPPSWPRTGLLNVVGNALLGKAPERVRRHRLRAVWQGLCECINGRGSVAITYR